MFQKKATLIRIPHELWSAIKHHAVDKEVTFNALIIDILTRAMAKRLKKTSKLLKNSKSK